MEYGMDKRIDRMFVRDRRMACIALLALWGTLAYVYVAISKSVPDPAVKIALTLGVGGVLIFNSASIIAMVRHYRKDKTYIYGLDLHHLDESRARKAEAAVAANPGSDDALSRS